MNTRITGKSVLFSSLLAAALTGSAWAQPAADPADDDAAIVVTEQELHGPDENPDVHDGGRAVGTSVVVVGRRALFGAPGTPLAGVVYEFERDEAGDWVFSQRIIPPHLSPTAGFGSRIAFDGDTALITSLEGNAYYYVRRKDQWRLLQVFHGTGHFGAQLAMQGCEAMISDSRSAPDPATVVDIYDRCRHGLWRKVTALRAPDAEPGSLFGASIALQGREMLIGAPLPGLTPQGAAFYYVRHDGRWIEKQKLVTADAGASSQFGSGVALDGRLAVIGDAAADFVDLNTPRDGAAYVFVHSTGGWVEEQKLQPQLGQTFDDSWDRYGQTLALENGLLVIGAPGSFAPGYELPGRTFVYRRRHRSFDFVESLSGHGESAHNGAAVSLWGRTLMVGEPAMRFFLFNEFDGAVYAYRVPKN